MAKKFLLELTSRTATEGNVVRYSWFQTAMLCRVKAVNEGKIYEKFFNHKSLNDTGGKAPNNVNRARIFPCDCGGLA